MDKNKYEEVKEVINGREYITYKPKKAEVLKIGEKVYKEIIGTAGEWGIYCLQQYLKDKKC